MAMLFNVIHHLKCIAFSRINEYSLYTWHTLTIEDDACYK